MSFVESRGLQRGDMVRIGNYIYTVRGLEPLYSKGPAGHHGGAVLLSDNKWHGWWEFERCEGLN